jgi:hypothetical protein
MAFSRYQRDEPQLDGKALSIPLAVVALRAAIKDGRVRITQSTVTTQSDRLDNMAAAFYGDGRYWWILAAASSVGWGLQVPPGILINIPDLKDVERLVG